jgi:hypothetical protein
MAWASQLAAHVAEICDNDVDDDCDGIVDERYQTSASNGTTGVDGPACAFACDAVDQGKLACSILGDRQPLERFQPAGPDNTPQTWFFDPPWFDKYWKVIKCQDGYWQINEVCGLDQTQLPRVAGNWGGNFGAQGCKSSSPGVAACTSDTTGLTFAGCADTAPPGGRDTPTPASCLDCWDPTAGTVGLVSDVCASRTQ